MNKLFSTQYGSKLFGTSTPTSDTDIKHIVLPSMDSLLLGNKVVNVVKKTNTAKNTRNEVDDIDEEFIPIQIFANDFLNGQTYAIELAFAIDSKHAGQEFPYRIGSPGEFGDFDPGVAFVKFTKELRTKFLTSNIKAMMGYVVNQANLYSFKGERLNATKAFDQLLDHYIDSGDLKLGDVFRDDEHFAQRVEKIRRENIKYFNLTEYDIGTGIMKPCFTLLEKTLPFTNTLEQTSKVVKTLINKYGARAEAASADNVDWKATMHAVRIVDTGLKILAGEKLVFPYDPVYVARLLAIKRGELPLEPIKEELATKLDRLKDLEKATSLPALTPALRVEFDSWLLGWLKRFYQS